MSLAYLGWNSDVKPNEIEKIKLPHPKDIDLNEVFTKQKEIKQSGECLFYEQSECNEVINAHSIQKSGALTLIAKNGMVYVPSSTMSDLKKSNGQITLKSRSIETASTFRGFCDYHDNYIFRAIDDHKLEPTREQAFLYAYRTLCRETHVKYCALKSYTHQLDHIKATTATQKLLKGMIQGTELGLRNLLRQKQHYDETHKNDEFHDINYVIFTSASPPSIVFSGCIFPEYGFNGEPLQQLGTPNIDLDLITFSFAPMQKGWGIVFAWHDKSNAVCEAFISTLAKSIHSGKSIDDLLFELVFTNCENLAVSPDWFESKSPDQRDQLARALSLGTQIFSPTQPDYISNTINGICDWKFDSVKDSRE